MKSPTMPQAVFFGAVILAVAIYLAATTGYRYQLMAPNAPRLAIPPVWKIDKFTGPTWECYPYGTPSPGSGCYLVSN